MGLLRTLDCSLGACIPLGYPLPESDDSSSASPAAAAPSFDYIPIVAAVDYANVLSSLLWVA